ncbi:uncharacterized protein TNCV_4543531 [Trichonephila clavipes]|nr:uncharacterized protein TNCV_4543531 [Trichonephila clavipes]
MMPLEDADKNGRTKADFSALMVAVNLGPQQITADRAKFTLIPIATPPAILAFTLSSQIAVVLGSISRTSLVVSRGTLTAQWYLDDILRTVLQSILLQYPGLIFQQIIPDHIRHACCYELSYSLSNTYLAAKLPDLSPIEHVWDMMGRRMHLLGKLVTWLDNWSTFGKKYRRRPYWSFITLCHVVWQLASRLSFPKKSGLSGGS